MATNTLPKDQVCSITCPNTGRVCYLTDLRGCDGRKKNGTRCDYGHGAHDKALQVSAHEAARHTRYYESLSPRYQPRAYPIGA